VSALAYIDHYTRGPFQPYVKELRTASGLDLLEVLQPAGDLSDPPVRELVLIQALSGFGSRIDHGAGKFSHRAAAGDFYVAPPECATEVILDHANELRCLALPVSALADGATENRTDAFAPLCAGAFRNEWLCGLLDRLWMEVGTGNGRGRLYSDAMALIIVSELRRQAAIRVVPHGGYNQGGLASWQLRRVCDYLNSHLDQDHSLAELARLVDLSTFHFCRAFKRSTGTTPHAWLTDQRIERAKDIMNSDVSIGLTEVALCVGYGSQSAFGTAFRRVTGTTPSAWRREHLL
jgi:AraC family transcriptional regulator